MKDINDKNISLYIERFLAGETSCKEEEAIYAYFRRDDIPADMEAYRPMFAWYGQLAPAETSAPKVRLLRMRHWLWTGVAAMLAVLFAVGFIFHAPSSLPDEYLAYEGSYIIRDGKKITDLSVVVPEIERAERLVNERLRQFDRQIEEADEAFERSVTTGYDLSDPEVKEVIEATLHY